MPEAITGSFGRSLRAAAIAIGAALAFAAPAGAATTTYPTGAGTFDAGAQGWAATDETCTGGILCMADASHDASGGNPGGALATRFDFTLALFGLFTGSAVWQSPSFAIPADADVTGASLAFDVALDVGGVTLAIDSTVEVELEDLTVPGTTPLGSAAIDQDDAAFATFGGAVAGAALVPGRSYRLVVTTTTGSDPAALALAGRATTRLDNVELAMTTADPPPPQDDGRDGDRDGGGSGGGDAPGRDAGGGSGGPAPPAVPTGSATAPLADVVLTRNALLQLLRALDLRAQSGPLAGGSLVPRGRCTLVGTPGRDRLVGTPGIDVICGLGGNDTIHGGGAADVIDGGAGRDRARGGAGGDVLLGLAGADRLVGGAGRDVLAGGAGRDRLRGGPAVDRLLGGTGRDVARGGLRGDTVSAVERRRR